MNYLWQVKSRYPKDLVKSIIENRSIENPQDFLHPDYKNLCSTKLLLNLPAASKRIDLAIKNNQKVGLFCDYDADGVCGGAIVFKALELMGLKVLSFVPERKDGYGLSKRAVEFFIKESVGLVITVDCGIKNILEIKELKDEGIDTIIVDHHIIDGDLPSAIVIHPALTKNKVNLELSGGGTAYMVARFLLKESGAEKWLIDLAAISSVADVVPFNHDNRILVKYGLMVLEKTKNLGLQKLLKITGLQGKKLGVYELGFVIAPRLNAAGRIAHPIESFNLLTQRKNLDALAAKLNKLNATRQEMLLRAVEEATKIVEEKKFYKNNLIILRGKWDEGIVGLVASKISDKYYRPTIVLSEGDILKGSARSVEKVNITKLISTAEDFLVSFGGHSQAAGLSLELKDFKKIENILHKEAKKIAPDSFKKILIVDAMIDFEKLSISLAEEIESLSPFGPGNPRPILALRKVKIIGFETIGKDQTHRKVHFTCVGKDGCFLLFNFLDRNLDFDVNDEVDIAFSVNINEFRGNKRVDLIVEDVKKSK